MNIAASQESVSSQQGFVAKRRSNRDFGYSLSRSKSVCDISSMSQRDVKNVSVDVETESVASSSKTSENVATNRNANFDGASLASRGSKSSRVVRNRTILGSFPLFYKLSQSLSSLNTNTTTETSGTNCQAFVDDNANSGDDLLNRKLDPR